ncbi:hypothetical protein [uncultured Arcobacter sp.]|uniref:hypothetical protein n=1 Tax=uncultured Arcobacter sp. TaxID=165434 RepID=UPI0026331D41|nr:hypothetical protein [uncultured Arcobacter sp.]
MRKLFIVLLIIAFATTAFAGWGSDSQESQEAQKVAKQQRQYSIGQPIPYFDWSLERDLVIQLYQVRNKKVATHSVWRSDYGFIEGDCPSFGYGIPYDTSLTNPLVATHEDSRGYGGGAGALTSVEQAEPNGIFASKNTSATWVMCLSETGTSIEPIYVETKVTVYPYPVKVDYDKNRVKRAGKASVNMVK